MSTRSWWLTFLIANAAPYSCYWSGIITPCAEQEILPLSPILQEAMKKNPILHSKSSRMPIAKNRSQSDKVCRNVLSCILRDTCSPNNLRYSRWHLGGLRANTGACTTQATPRTTTRLRLVGSNQLKSFLIHHSTSLALSIPANHPAGDTKTRVHIYH